MSSAPPFRPSLPCLGGTQSLHTNGSDEALALPTEAAARVALRTQQVIAHESGIADTVDPLAGSYAVEHLTDELETRAAVYIEKIDALGGMLRAIELGYPQREIQEAAYNYQRAVETGDATVVGVNRFQVEEDVAPPLLSVEPAIEAAQVERLRQLRARRDAEAVEAGSPRSNQPPARRTKICSRSSSPPSRLTRRSARSAIASGASGASTEKR
jgi:methylmalonyl-CoA mutase N-terminal domain/subunit